MSKYWNIFEITRYMVGRKKSKLFAKLTFSFWLQVSIGLWKHRKKWEKSSKKTWQNSITNRWLVRFSGFFFLTFYLVHLIKTTNTNLEFLHTYFVSKYWQDKSFKLRPKYFKKCQYNSLQTKKIKTLCNTLNWGNWNRNS